MTIGEFKAWLEGFEEALDGKAPTLERWRKIKIRIDTLTAFTIPDGISPSPHAPSWPIVINEPGEDLTFRSVWVSAPANGTADD